MKIAVIAAWTAANHVGGVENHVKSVFELLGQRHDVRSFSSDFNQQLSTKKMNLAGLARGFAAKAALNLRQLRHFRDIRAFDPDVVHQHDLSSSFLLIVALKLAGYRIVLTNHTGEYLYAKRVLGPLPDLVLRSLYTAIIGPSAELTPTGSKSVTIHNGYDEAVFYPRKLGRDEVLSAEVAEIAARFRRLVLVPRRWAPTKGVIYALRAAARLPDVCFLFAGSGYDNYPGYKALCLEERAKSGLGNTVLLGDVDQATIADLLNIVDAVLMPSLVEAVSLSAVEANACGRALFVSAVPGNQEIVSEGVNGFLFAPADPDAIVTCLSANLDRISDDDFARRCLTAVEGHRWSAIAAKTEAVLESVARGDWPMVDRLAIDMRAAPAQAA